VSHTGPPRPVATYRLQLRAEWGFAEAAATVPYLRRLGASHVYLSPVAMAARSSTHGYDVVDPTRVDEERGGPTGLDMLWAALRDAGMAAIVDLVPNHVSVASDRNPWWQDVLTHGPASRHADWFDIDWHAPGAKGRVVLPVLGGPLEEVLDDLAFERAGAGWRLRYFEHRFPLAPGTGPGADPPRSPGTGPGPDPPASPPGSDDLRAVLEQQHYRLTWWRDPLAPNYRRFFDISDLAAVRVEHPPVFEAHTALLRTWLADDVTADLLAGVRVDHVDGLNDPEGYLRALRSVIGEDRLLLVEKILHEGEALPAGWPVDGTTGYEVGDVLIGLLVDPAAEEVLDDLCETMLGRRISWAETVAESKALVLERTLRPEVARLERELAPLVGEDRRSGDDDRDRRTRTLHALLAGFDVYRTYVDATGAGPRDRAVIEAAARRARSAPGAPDPELTDRVVSLLTGPQDPHELAWVRRFQQTTPPLAAKAVEDTALYRHPRMVARNDVGSDPSRLSWSTEEAHARLDVTRGGLVSTSTHDTKRSEDVRARVAALSLVADEWSRAVRDWSSRAQAHRRSDAPEPEIELLAWQTMIGAWPLSADRLVDYLRKAAREAKLRTSWTDVDEHYEAGLERWARAVCADADITAGVRAMVERVLEAGHLGSLAVTAAKLTAAGVPDLYQGSELWDLSLVDPDNRRPVDYRHREALLHELSALDAPSAWARAEEGTAKLFLVQRLLAVRARHLDAFAPGARHEALAVEGPDAHRVLARCAHGQVLTVAGLRRLTASTPLDADIVLPPGRWRHAVGDGTHDGGTVALRALLSAFPVAVLERD
jgi:(1->4)-alpha-D-glucan 1-alpha-D-glucosylmutase